MVGVKEQGEQNKKRRNARKECVFEVTALRKRNQLYWDL